MPRQRLTLPRIAAFSPKKEGFLWDEESPRLAVRARASGSKTFIFKGSLNYLDIRITIGSVDAWTIEAARDQARRFQRMIDEGKDPRDVLRQEGEDRAAEEAARLTAIEAAKCEALRIEVPALEVWTAYIEARRPKWSAAHLGDHLNVSKEGGEPRTRGRRKGESDVTLPGALRPLLLLPLARIDADRVRVWLEDEASHRPTHARLAYGLLRAFLNWCADRPEYRAQIHADACTPRAAREALPKKASKDDCLQREQLRVWFAEVKKLNPVQSAYLQTVLITGPRRNELTSVRWEDVDFKWNAITIHDKNESKGGLEGTRTIPLTPYVKSLLLGLKAINETPPAKFRILRGKRVENDLNKWESSKFVFWSRAESGHIEEPRSAHDRAMKAAGIPDLTIHGLRRSFATLSEWVEAPEGVVAQIQGHKPSATREKHYKKRPLDLLRMWHVKIEAWILEQAGIEQPGEEQAAGLRVVKA